MKVITLTICLLATGCYDWEAAAASAQNKQLSCLAVNKNEASVQIRSDNRQKVVKDMELYIHQRTKSWYVPMKNSTQKPDIWTPGYNLIGLNCNRRYTYTIK